MLQRLLSSHDVLLVVIVALSAAVGSSHVQDGSNALLPRPEGVCKSVFQNQNGSLEFFWLDAFKQEIDHIDDLTHLSSLNTFLYAPGRKQRPRDAAAIAANEPVDRPRPPLMYCWIPKNACSMFKLLFQRLILNDTEWAQRSAFRQGTPHAGAHVVKDLLNQQHWAAKVTLSQIMGAADPFHTASMLPSNESRVLPGIVITRNPYVRLLSGYLDQVMVVHGHVNKTWHAQLLKAHSFNATETPSFKEWVKRLVKIGPWYINRHFRPQVLFCGQKFGVKMQYQIKLEQLPVVYPCLVHQLGWGHWVDTQWQDVYRRRDCFYKPRPDLPCSWWRDALDRGDLLGGLKGVDSNKGSLAMHRTNAVASLHKYYDRETAELATSFYAEDLAMFGYRTWAGPPDDLHLD